MRVKHLFFVFAICIVSFLLPYHVGTAQEEGGVCPKPYIKAIFPRAAQPGVQVKIRGVRFGTEKGEVLFSSEAKAEIAKWTLHRIWVIVPDAATSGPVVVRVSCGSESNKHYFTVKK